MKRIQKALVAFLILFSASLSFASDDVEAPSQKLPSWTAQVGKLQLMVVAPNVLVLENQYEVAVHAKVYVIMPKTEQEVLLWEVRLNRIQGSKLLGPWQKQTYVERSLLPEQMFQKQCKLRLQAWETTRSKVTRDMLRDVHSKTRKGEQVPKPSTPGLPLDEVITLD